MPQNFMIKTGIIIIIMWKLLGLLFSASLVVAVPLDCESNLKLLYPEWFAHCNCSYSDWSEWQLVEESVVDVPTSQCDSGQAYSESRTRSALGDGCNLETQKRMICKPRSAGIDCIPVVSETLGGLAQYPKQRARTMCTACAHCVGSWLGHCPAWHVPRTQAFGLYHLQ